MCGKGTNSTNQGQVSKTTSPLQQNYLAFLNKAESQSETPWNPATSQQVAGFDPAQNQAYANVMGGIAKPYIDNAAQLAMSGAGPVSQTLQQYANPFQQNVIDSTLAQMGRSDARELSGIKGANRISGSLGGDREAVAGELARERQEQQRNQVISNLNYQGYNSALGAAQNDASRQLQGSGIMGGLASGAYLDTNMMNQYGGQRQALSQAELDAATANATAQSAHPFASLGWYGSLLQGIGSQAGSTTTSVGSKTGPQPNTWSQAAGIGIAALPYLGLHSGGRIPYAAGGGIGYIPQMPMSQSGGLHPSALMKMDDDKQNSGGSFAKDAGDTAKLASQAFAALGFASGGGIGYVPQIQMGSSQGLQPSALMNMSGGDQKQKSLADHYKEIQDTAKSASQAFKGIDSAASKVGEAMRTETMTTAADGRPLEASNWNNVTTTFPDAGQNISYGLSNTFGGIGSIFGYAAGGGVDDNDPAGSYDRAPVEINAPLFGDRAPPPSFVPPMMPANPRDTYGPAGGGIEPQGNLVPIADVDQRGQASGAPAGAGDIYAPPPVNVLNPRGGGIDAMPAPSSPAPAPESRNLLQRFGDWVTSDEGKAFTGRMGAAMMAGSGVGGRGSFGIHAGQGLTEGFKAQDDYRKSQREQAIEQGKMKLAERASQIRDAEEGRAAQTHPYDMAHKQAQTKALLAQAANKEDPTQAYRIRAIQAKALGIDEKSREYQEFVLTGKMSKDEVSPTAQKQILESSESNFGIPLARQYVNEAIALNDKATEGYLGRVWAQSIDPNLPSGWRTDTSQATRDLSRSMMGNVLGKLKETFGSAPTEGERKILIDVETAMDKTAKDRADILRRALKELDKREKLNTMMLDQLRGKTMFKPQPAPAGGIGSAPNDPLGLRQ